MRRKAAILSAVVLAAALVLAAGGCQSTALWASRDTTRVAPHYAGRAASLVFDSPQLAPRLAQMNAQLAAKGLAPWYASRNDARLTTYAGLQGPTYEVSSTWSVDQQYSVNGRAYDVYSNTTYRRSVTTTSR